MTSPGPWSWGAGAGKWVLCDANDKRMISFSEWSIESGDMSLIAVAPELLAMLRALEWGKDTGGRDSDHSFCPWCCNTGREDHEPDCRLARLLGRVK